MRSGGVKYLPRFFRSERNNLLTLDSDRLYDGRDISLDQSPPQRDIQRGAKSRVNVLHRPRGQPLST